jgi:hypothetical protein
MSVCNSRFRATIKQAELTQYIAKELIMKDSKTKVHDGEWKKISFGEFDALLREQDIEPSAFAFSIAVDYLEQADRAAFIQEGEDE